MYSLETIFSLIHSLTKSEKRYFRSLSDLQQGEKNYIRLFDFLEKRPVFDDAVAKELAETFPNMKVEPARKHLYTVLMKSLRQFERERDVETRLMNLLHDSRILFNKGMIRMSLEQLEKAKGIAARNEKFLYVIIASRQELQYLTQMQFEGMEEDLLLEKQNAIMKLIEQEDRINQHSTLYEVLLYRYWKNGAVRSREEATKLNDLLLKEYQLLNAAADKTFESERLHYHFQSVYFQMTGNPGGSLESYYDLDTLYQEHDYLLKEEPLSYFYLLDGILSDLRSMDRYQEMDFFLNRLKEMSGSALSLQPMIKYRMLDYELKRFIDQGSFARAKVALDQYLPALHREIKQLPFQMRAQLIFTISRMWMGLGNYKEALKLLNSGLNQPSSAMNPSLRIIFLLMHVQVNALLKNTDYLSYAIRSVERKLKSLRKLHGSEQLIINYLKKWMACKPFHDFQKKLHDLNENPYEKLIIKDLCTEEWFRRMETKEGKIV